MGEKKEYENNMDMHIEAKVKQKPGRKNITWEQVLELLRTTHTICMRGICQELKSSRSWVAKYILPYLDKLYLDTGYRGNKKISVSWTQMAAMMLQDPKKEGINPIYLNNSVWCNKTQYEMLLKLAIISITKQTKYIPIELLMKKNGINIAEKYKKITEEINEKTREMNQNCYRFDNMRSMYEIKRLKQEQDKLINDNLSLRGRQILSADRPIITQRNKTIPVSVPLPDTPIKEWKALHDEKDYGDTDEKVLRNFFTHGFIRIELAIPDPKQIDGDVAAIFASIYASMMKKNAISRTVNGSDIVSNMVTICDDNNEDHIASDMVSILETLLLPYIDAHIEGKNVKCSKKIFYIEDPEPILHQNVDYYVTISELTWRKWKTELIKA